MPISPGMALLNESSDRIKSMDQVINVAKIAPKLNKVMFKKRCDIGTKKKMMMIRLGTNKGFKNVL